MAIITKYDSFIAGDWHCAYVLLYGPRLLELPTSTDEPMITDPPAQ